MHMGTPTCGRSCVGGESQRDVPNYTHIGREAGTTYTIIINHRYAYIKRSEDSTPYTNAVRQRMQRFVLRKIQMQRQAQSKTHTYVHISMCARVYIYVHIDICDHLHRRTYICMRVYMHIGVYIHTHIHIYI